jgi:hypothetical protein
MFLWLCLCKYTCFYLSWLLPPLTLWWRLRATFPPPDLLQCFIQSSTLMRKQPVSNAAKSSNWSPAAETLQYIILSSCILWVLVTWPCQSSRRLHRVLFFLWALVTWPCQSSRGLHRGMIYWVLCAVVTWPCQSSRWLHSVLFFLWALVT